jgi:hypothetical protein
MVMRDAAIVTTARNGNGGDVRVNAGRLLLMDHSQIVTSSLGAQNGNGGNIAVDAQMLVLNTGFIEANTEAPHANGGNVAIEVGTIVAAGSVVVGGNSPLQFTRGLSGINVIQAASPSGLSGQITVSAPVLDIAGNLKPLSTTLVSAPVLSRDLCRLSGASSMTPVGRGGLRPTATGFIRPESLSAPPLAQGRSLQPRDETSLHEAGVSAYRCEYSSCIDMP